MSQATTYTIGTRGSLLATTQTLIVKETLEKRYPHVKFVIKTIKTQGDMNQKDPLWQMDGKDFFTKELDEALLKQEIDLVVHSYKDLGGTRPEDIELMAITERFYANDILLITQETKEKLDHLSEFQVGTSSPRRIYQIENFLNNYLPRPSMATKERKISCSVLRGNVNTRIEKLRRGDYHAIVLALAGIDRLSKHSNSKEQLAKLLEGLDFLILPLTQFPTAAAQGALALETHKNASVELKEIVHSLHHPKTAEEVKNEKIRFQEWGGGCHLAVGIHFKKTDFGMMEIQQGTNVAIETFHYAKPMTPIDGPIFIGLSEEKGLKYVKKTKKKLIFDQLLSRKSLTIERKAVENFRQFFISSNYCLESYLPHHQRDFAVWASGKKTAKQLSEKNIWINGMSEFQGVQDIEHYLSSPAIQMLLGENRKDFAFLSHDKDPEHKIASYTHIKNEKIDPLWAEEIKSCRCFIWTSIVQFNYFCEIFPDIMKNENVHFAGSGVTGLKLQKIIPPEQLKFFVNLENLLGQIL